MATETKFTPGPWCAYIDDGACIVQSDSSGFAVADANRGSDHPLSTEWDSEWVAELDSQAVANAHLIAAAPELYAALDEALAALYGAISVCGAIGNLTHARDLAQSALAKVRGEAV